MPGVLLVGSPSTALQDSAQATEKQGTLTKPLNLEHHAPNHLNFKGSARSQSHNMYSRPQEGCFEAQTGKHAGQPCRMIYADCPSVFGLELEDGSNVLASTVGLDDCRHHDSRNASG